MSTALESFLALPLVGILRGCADRHLPNIVECIQRGGMVNLEVTMNSAGADRQIREAVRYSEGRLNIGAGTVTSTELLERALVAGAAFIVTPFLTRDVVAACVQRGIPVFPGTLTPTEIYTAWEMGATMVKIFPAEFGGAKYVRALRGPFPKIPLMPTGGVDLESLPGLIEAGASGFGIGSSLFERERLEAEDWQWLEKQVRALVDRYRDSQTKIS